MSRPDEARSPRDARLIDLLVDGALGPAERSELLIRLEHEPDGWRRCALAFLEAQAWREAFAPLTAGVSSPSRPLAASPAGRSRREHRGQPSEGSVLERSSRKIAALAAGLFLAFLTGWVAGGASRAPDLATVVAPEPRARGPREIEERGGDPQPIGDPDEASARSVASRLTPPTVRPVQYRSGPSEVPTPLPDPVLRQLERRGFQVEQRRALMSMDLRDGRRLAVPVDAWKLHFVGDRTY